MTYHNIKATKVTGVCLWVNEPVEPDVRVYPEHQTVSVGLGNADVQLRSAAAARSLVEVFAEAARQLGEMEAQAATDQTPDGPSAWSAALEEAA